MSDFDLLICWLLRHRPYAPTAPITYCRRCRREIQPVSVVRWRRVRRET